MIPTRSDPSIASRVKLVHVSSGLEVGGKELVVLDLAQRARRLWWDARLCLSDTPFRDEERDFAPREVPCAFLRRCGRGAHHLGQILELARGNPS